MDLGNLACHCEASPARSCKRSNAVQYQNLTSIGLLPLSLMLGTSCNGVCHCHMCISLPMRSTEQYVWIHLLCGRLHVYILGLGVLLVQVVPGLKRVCDCLNTSSLECSTSASECGMLPACVVFAMLMSIASLGA
jgi:hypothetical protein